MRNQACPTLGRLPSRPIRCANGDVTSAVAPTNIMATCRRVRQSTSPTGARGAARRSRLLPAATRIPGRIVAGASIARRQNISASVLNCRTSKHVSNILAAVASVCSDRGRCHCVNDVCVGDLAGTRCQSYIDYLLRHGDCRPRWPGNGSGVCHWDGRCHERLCNRQRPRRDANRASHRTANDLFAHTSAVDEQGRKVFRQQDGEGTRGLRSSHGTASEGKRRIPVPHVYQSSVPLLENFLPIGHCWWALLLGYIGGLFTTYVFQRRQA